MVLRRLFLTLCVTWMASCSLSTVEFDDELDVESSFVSGSEVAFDAIQSSDVSTRTEIGDDMTTTMWSPDDKIYLWAYDGTTAAVSGQEFSLKYYGSNYDEALFIGSVDEMDEDVQYRYYAVYPEPVSVSGDNVTYNISSVQSGKYDENSCDIMVAGAVVSDAFKLGEKSDLELPFRHLLHAIRVVVPEGRNFLGDSISQLEITFPSNVVGDVSFAITGLDANGDALTDLPQTTFTNATNVLNVEFDQAIAEETYIWMFIYPQTINGEIRFKAFDESGRQSQYIYATLSNRSMEAGKVTPIDLTIPEELERTILKLNLTANNLGEDPTTLTFTAPDETLYRNGKNEVSQSYELNGEYSLSYYTDLYGPLFENTGIVITYDSPNALVQNTLTLTNLVANETNYYDISVPYLLDEDFSGVSSSFEYYTDPGGSVSSSTGHHEIELDSYNLSGWTGDRVGGSAGYSIRTMCRLEGGMWVQYLYEGRIDSAPITTIKDGKTVKLLVSYTVSGSENEYTGSKDGTPKYSHGYTTYTGALSSADGIQYTVASSIQQGTSGSYTNVTTAKSYNISSASSATRLSWLATVTRSSEFAQGGNYWLYIDNIKVKIVE